ncbi:MAG: glycine cleavage system protein GcvH [Candidatus Pacebacteria bacterium]|nr:glycine cleavage system protein GcvH [Candidatus Paceibacterota bacterium]
MTPNDRKYTKTHEWIKMDGEVAVVGITDHAQENLGDVTFVELPEVGANVDKGDECAEIESVKAASDIYAPVAGEVAEVNEALEDAPELVNESPYEKGWIFKLKSIDSSELDALLDSAGYESVVEEEEE